MRLISFLTVTLILFSFVGCEDEDDTPSKKDLLVEKKWELSALTVDPAIPVDQYGTMATDLYAQMDNCEKDNVLYLKENGNYSWEEGTTKCESDDPQVFETGTWSFNSDKTVLVLSRSDGENINYDIEDISSSELILSWQETAGTGTNYTYTVTFNSN